LNAIFYPSSLFLRTSYFIRLRRPRCFPETRGQPLAAAQNSIRTSDFMMGSAGRARFKVSISLLAQ
jgi:hypothetical protein